MYPRGHAKQAFKLLESSQKNTANISAPAPQRNTKHNNNQLPENNMYWRRFTRGTNLLKPSSYTEKTTRAKESVHDNAKNANTQHKNRIKPKIRRLHSGEFTTVYSADNAGGVSEILGTYHKGRRVEPDCVSCSMM